MTRFAVLPYFCSKFAINLSFYIQRKSKMKKILLFAVALATLTLAACGGKTGKNSDPDSLAIAESVNATPSDAAATIIAALQEQLKNADPAQIKTIVATVSETIQKYAAENDNEAVQTYTALVSNFVAENAEALQKVGAATSIAEAVAAIPNLPSNVLETAAAAVNGTKTAALTSAISAIATGESVGDAVQAALTNSAAEIAADAASQAAGVAADAAQAKAQTEAAAAAAKAAVEAAPEAAKEATKKAASDAANKAIDDAAAAAKKSLGL